MKRISSAAAGLVATIAGLLASAQSHAQGGAEKSLQDALSAAERICLVGNRYKFSVDLKGGVIIRRLMPAGGIQGSYEELHARGGVDFQNEEIRRFVDADIRDCMMKAWPPVHEVLRSAGVDLPQSGAGSEVVKARVVGDLVVTLENSGTDRGRTDFGLIAVNRSDRPMRLMVQHGVQVGPLMVDERGRAKSTQTVVGLPRCGWDTRACFNEVRPENWALANKGIHLPFSINFSHTEVPDRSMVNLSFTLLQSIEGAGGRATNTAIPISFLRIPVRR